MTGLFFSHDGSSRVRRPSASTSPSSVRSFVRSIVYQLYDKNIFTTNSNDLINTISKSSKPLLLPGLFYSSSSNSPSYCRSTVCECVCLTVLCAIIHCCLLAGKEKEKKKTSSSLSPSQFLSFLPSLPSRTLVYNCRGFQSV